MRKIFASVVFILAFVSAGLSQQMILKSSTSYPILFGPIIDSSDHISGKTGISSFDLLKISKGGGTGVTPSGSVTELDATNFPGWYKIAGNATDTGTDGPILLHAEESGADDFDMVAAVVVEFNPRSATTLQDIADTILDDACGAHAGLASIGESLCNTYSIIQPFYNSIAKGSAAVVAATSTTVTLNSSFSSSIDGTYTGNTITIGSCTAGGQTRLVASYVGSTRVATINRAWTTTPDSSCTYYLNGSDITGDPYARLGAPAGASVSADIAAVKALLPAALISGRMDVSLGAIQSGVDFSTTMKTSIRTAASPAIQKNVVKEWPFRMSHADGTPMTSGTPSCVRGLDSVSSTSGTANSPASVGSTGLTEITLAGSDLNGSYYTYLKCTQSGAKDYEYIFLIQP